ncbi:MAG: M4 family metallopeptidase [Bacteroidia bacterium]|nr:M4 family metallopeptidase [Bacteroidia bacterium]
MFRCLLFVTFIILTIKADCQETTLSKRLVYNANKIKQINAVESDVNAYFKNNAAQFGLSKYDKLVSSNSRKNRNGTTVKKYRQYYKNLNVIGGTYILHTKGNQIEKGSGSLWPFIDIEVEPKLSFDDVIQDCEVQLKKALTLTQNIYNPNTIDFQFENEGLCIIDKSYPDFSGDYRLVYQVSATSPDKSDPINEEVYLDASDGRLITHFSHIHIHQVPGVVKTSYYGEREVIIDSIAPDEYLLQDLSRGLGVITLDEDLDVYEHDQKYWDLTNENLDEVSGDLHYGASAFYDMMLDRFEWSGIDGDGGELISVAHAGGKFLVNAYWDGRRARFGNGDCDRYKPLVTLDIVGHEFAHGITDYTSDLIYSRESGALNESFSDIFGKALEYYYDYDNFTWLIGDQIRRHEEVNFIRSMVDPRDRSDPKFYKGIHWASGSGDNYGVHTNSGVLNHWFYLLVEGGIGTNEVGEPYQVFPIGMDDAIEIAFTMQSSYLTENSNYFDALYASIESSKDLFGDFSFQEESVINAWKAVGLYPGINNLFVKLELPKEVYTACPSETVYPECYISNIGRENIPAGTEFVLILEASGTNKVFEDLVLDEEFEVGDSIFYTFQEPFGKSLINNGFFDISIEVKNVISALSEVRGDYISSDVEGVDIELVSIDLYNRDPCLSSDIDLFRYRIDNKGCRSIEIGDSIFFEIKTDKGDLDFGIRMFFELEPGESTLSSRGVNAISPDFPSDIKSYSVILVHKDDDFEENNFYENDIVEVFPIERGYSENFEGEDQSHLYVLNASDFYNGDTILKYRGNNMLGIYGQQDHSFYRNCENDIDFFEQYFFETRIEYCVDASEMTEPIFEFNAVMFLNEDEESLLTNHTYSSMLRVEYADISSQLIYDQPEGSLINHKVALPENYSGELQIVIVTLTKDGIFENEDITKDRDLVLIDDIKLYEKKDDKRTYTEGGYVIYPNPVKDVLRFSNSSNQKIFDIVIHNTIGQLIYKQNGITNQDWISTDVLSSGLYFISFIEDDEIVDTSKFFVAE